MLCVEVDASIVTVAAVAVAGNTLSSESVQVPAEQPGSLVGMLKLIVTVADPAAAASEFAHVTASRNVAQV
jgi:hypothetical protein